MNVLCRPTFVGGLDENAVVVQPGDPGGSLLVQRMGAADDRRMPPLGSARPDASGIAIVSAWISTLKSCDATAPSSSGVSKTVHGSVHR
jgi:hypothetical protein